MKRPRISVCMILKDCEDTIRRALDSVKGIAWEIVVVMDSRSSDDTERIVREEYGARVFSREWTGFSDQRNHGMAQARGDWLLFLDGDEEIKNLGGLMEDVAAAHEHGMDIIACRVQTVDGDARPHESEIQLRLARESRRCRFRYPIHNQLQGWRPEKVLQSDCLFWAWYVGDMRPRHERNLAGLLRMRDASEHGSDEWQHATFYLCKSHAMVHEWSASARYARDLIDVTPDHPAYSFAWTALIRERLMQDDNAGAWDVTVEAAKHVSGLADLWWWATAITLDRWARSALQPGRFRTVPQSSLRFVPGIRAALAALGFPSQQESAA